MIPRTLLVAAGILAAACFACAPPPPPGGTASQTCPDGSSFLSHVQILDPNSMPNGNAAPTGHPFSGSSAMSDDLSKAFAHAPAGFQQRLCGPSGHGLSDGLNGIFICPAGAKCNSQSTNSNFAGSWGYRSRNVNDQSKTYIAISATLWPAGGGSASALHDYETQLLQSFPGAGAVTAYSASLDDPWMTVLAALAHEVGHIRFVQTVKPSGPAGSYDFTKPLQCHFFDGWAYNTHNSPQNHPHMEPLNGWRVFGDRSNEAGQPIDHAMPPYLQAQLDLTPPASYPYLYQLYQANEPWASLFGAQAPDEDFVETYVMAVLTGYSNTAGSASFSGPLTSLALQIPGYTGPSISQQWADVPRDLVAKQKPALANKMACITY
jgi:hypothetical protein